MLDAQHDGKNRPGKRRPHRNALVNHAPPGKESDSPRPQPDGPSVGAEHIPEPAEHQLG